MKFNTCIDLILRHANPSYVIRQKGFFKEKYTRTTFLGIKVPQCRALALELIDTPYNVITQCILDNRHEVKLTGLLILNEKYKTINERNLVFDTYLMNVKSVNNWDLVDTSAPTILGSQLLSTHQHIMKDYKNEQISCIHLMPTWYQQLYTSTNLWEIRMSIICLLPLIRENILHSTSSLLISLIQRLNAPSLSIYLDNTLYDDYDLLYKAIGWMLREISKKNKTLIINLLHTYSNDISTITFSYASEKLTDIERKRLRNLRSNENKRKLENDDNNNNNDNHNNNNNNNNSSNMNNDNIQIQMDTNDTETEKKVVTKRRKTNIN